MKNFAKGMIVLLVICMCPLQAFGAVETNASSWAVSSMEKAYEAGLLPQRHLQNAKATMIRSDFCEIIINFCEMATGKRLSAQGETPFGDTSNEDVVIAYELGIIGGVSEGVFSPETGLTREQLAIILARTLSVCGVDLSGREESTPFTDISGLYDASRKNIERLYGAGIISGFDDQTYRPHNRLTTEEAVATFVRAYQFYLLETTGGTTAEPAVPVLEPKGEARDAQTSVNEPGTIYIDGKEISIGMTSDEVRRTWGEPDRVDATVYGQNRYIYINGYKTYFFVTFLEEAVVEIFTPGRSYSYMNISGNGTVADIEDVTRISAIEHSAVIEQGDIFAKIILDYEGLMSGIIIQTAQFANEDFLVSNVTEEMENAFCQGLLDIIQVKRLEQGLPLYVYDELLASVSNAHSEDMVRNNYFAYTGKDGRTPFARIMDNNMTFTTASEVITRQRGDVLRTYQEWVRTAANINSLMNSDMDCIGIGFASRSKVQYVTVDLCGGLKHIEN